MGTSLFFITDCFTETRKLVQELGFTLKQQTWIQIMQSYKIQTQMKATSVIPALAAHAVQHFFCVQC